MDSKFSYSYSCIDRIQDLSQDFSGWTRLCETRIETLEVSHPPDPNAYSDPSSLTATGTSRSSLHGSARIERFLICEPEAAATFPQALCERVAILFGDITQPLSS